jgi:hypothetical protein
VTSRDRIAIAGLRASGAAEEEAIARHQSGHGPEPQCGGSEEGDASDGTLERQTTRRDGVEGSGAWCEHDGMEPRGRPGSVAASFLDDVWRQASGIVVFPAPEADMIGNKSGHDLAASRG